MKCSGLLYKKHLIKVLGLLDRAYVASQPCLVHFLWKQTMLKLKYWGHVEYHADCFKSRIRAMWDNELPWSRGLCPLSALVPLHGNECYIVHCNEVHIIQCLQN